MSASIGKVGVLGAGTMGHGIAHVSALAGFEVVLYDVTQALAEQGRAKIDKNLEVGVQKGKLTAEQKAQALGRLSCAGTLDAVKDCGLVIEAVPEKMALKQELFQKLSALCASDAILASNTSSLSLTEIAAAAQHPGRVVGLHFFNPVHLMKLLEVVRAYQTSDETVARARAYGEAIGKQLVVVKDSPGFASTRLGVAVGLEAIRMLEEGVASAEDIDRAMELGYGFPMGPLKLGDLVGLDVRLSIAEYLHQELGSPTFRPPQLLKKMVRAGKLGKKTGEGFYRY
ncbi:MAG: 3-hydroxyacyl-CoA dehydrogenase family protein [Myxococcaceae bacterium]|nr:3-hydroxyacyl-CoA dehydrogenase family protein [Myxococcaceae bacterium]